MSPDRAAGHETPLDTQPAVDIASDGSAIVDHDPAQSATSSSKFDGPPVLMWTDGACKGNPGPGGWGVYLTWGDRKRDLWGGDPETTNNKMELTAVVQGLRALTRPCTVIVHVDSKYVMTGIQQWIHNWKKNGWRTAARKPVKNVELWKELDAEIARHKVSWQWVKGHAGDPGNERADELANRGVAELSQ